MDMDNCAMTSWGERDKRGLNGNAKNMLKIKIGE